MIRIVLDILKNIDASTIFNDIHIADIMKKFLHKTSAYPPLTMINQSKPYLL